MIRMNTLCAGLVGLVCMTTTLNAQTDYSSNRVPAAVPLKQQNSLLESALGVERQNGLMSEKESESILRKYEQVKKEVDAELIEYPDYAPVYNVTMALANGLDLYSFSPTYSDRGLNSLDECFDKGQYDCNNMTLLVIDYMRSRGLDAKPVMLTEVAWMPPETHHILIKYGEGDDTRYFDTLSKRSLTSVDVEKMETPFKSKLVELTDAELLGISLSELGDDAKAPEAIKKARDSVVKKASD